MFSTPLSGSFTCQTCGKLGWQPGVGHTGLVLACVTLLLSLIEIDNVLVIVAIVFG